MNDFQEYDEFDDFLRRKMEYASSSPPNHQWGRIRSRMRAMRAKRKMVLVITILAISSALIRDSYWNDVLRLTITPEVEGKMLGAIAIDNEPPQEYAPLSTPSLLKGSRLKSPAHKHEVSKAPSEHNDPIIPKRKDKAGYMQKQQALEPSPVEIPLMQLENTNSTITAKDEWVSIAPPSKKGWSIYLGWHGILKNTWIINQNTYNAFKGYEPRFLLDWGHSYGSHLGLRLKKNLWLELSANFLATQGQRYQDMLLGKDTYREIDLVYHQASGVLKKEYPIYLLGRKRRFYLEAGLQYARLLLARQYVNTSDIGVYRRFNENEISIILGYSCDWSVSKRLFFNTGIYARVGNDINAEGWAVDDKYGKSHNADIGFRLSLNYRFLANK